MRIQELQPWVGSPWEGGGSLVLRGLVSSLLILLMAGAGGCRDAKRYVERKLGDPPRAVAQPSVLGTLRVAAYGRKVRSGESPPHVTEWVNGADYSGMEDNDIRGFLDGRFVYGWNQPGQIHNRMGRERSRMLWGETELFRTLVRWADVRLPPGSRVERAELAFGVERGPKQPLDVLLYAINKDWNPGAGGERGDNTSPPQPGEVWWGELAHDQRPWGFAGAGFASDHEDADTPEEALAETRWAPGEDEVVFASDALARHIESRATQGLPLLFLMKLSDAYEDQMDTVLYVFSGNHGEPRNPARRPKLRVEWEGPRPLVGLARPVHLENGRMLVLPRIEARGTRFVAGSFQADQGHEAPILEIRGGSRGADSEWRRVSQPLAVEWDWLEVRVHAARHPVVLGMPFETSFKDTWVRTAPPEEQVVPFSFVSPRGEEHRVEAQYTGDYTWGVTFEPTELGRWRYRWKQDFLKKPYRSAEGVFDVVPGDRENVALQLRALLERIRETEPPEPGVVPDLVFPFWKLERAVYQLETPQSMKTDRGLQVYALLTELREALSGRTVPDEQTPSPMRRDF